MATYDLGSSSFGTPVSARQRQLEEMERKQLLMSQALGEESANAIKAQGQGVGNMLSGAAGGAIKGMEFADNRAKAQQQAALAEETAQRQNAAAELQAQVTQGQIDKQQADEAFLSEEVAPGMTRRQQQSKLDQDYKQAQIAQMEQGKWQVTSPDAAGNVYRVNPTTGEHQRLMSTAVKPKEEKPLTGDQVSSAGFARRLEQAEDVFNKLTESGYKRETMGESAQSFDPTGKFKSPQFVKQEQAERNFINAVLRKESGAAISPSEFENAEKQYFPRPGDTPESLAQKRANRMQAIETLKLGAGPAYEKLPLVQVPGTPGIQQADNGAPPQGGLVTIEAPDGTRMDVPVMSVPKYTSKGGRVVSQPGSVYGQK